GRAGAPPHLRMAEDHSETHLLDSLPYRRPVRPAARGVRARDYAPHHGPRERGAGRLRAALRLAREVHGVGGGEASGRSEGYWRGLRRLHRHDGRKGRCVMRCYYGDQETCDGDLWECQTCGELYCQAHWHSTAKGENVECVACEFARNHPDEHRPRYEQVAK